MKRKIVFVVFMLLGVIILSGCQPKIYGQVRRKKDRKCGCQLIKTSPAENLYTYIDSK